MGRQREAAWESLPAEWVPMPVLMPQRSQTLECVLLTLWAWGMEVAMLVELQAHSPQRQMLLL